MIIYLSAISIGLLGSFHCLGMCGPIAMAIPLDRTSSTSIISGSLLYNFGRLLAYFLIGLLLGSIGNGFAIAGIQQYLSLAVGILMILSSFSVIISVPIPFYHRLLSRLKSAMSNQFSKRTNRPNKRLFIIGWINGLLPCGLVYIGLAGAMAMASPIEGGLFMLAFGLGTLPLMLSFAILGARIQWKSLGKLKRLVPVFLFMIGTLFVLRGMNLGIPYISPKIQTNSQIIKCH